jgi:hypothetical protein
MASTLLLDRTLWDLCLTTEGNIAVASEPYAIAQDVASAVRLFDSELWYDTDKGVPYFSEILGHQPPLSLMKAEFIKAALTVPLVASVKVFVSNTAEREVTGQIQITDTSQRTVVVTGNLLNSPIPQ